MQQRANPIPETLESIQGGYPESLQIYRIPASKYWYVRCRMERKRVTKSLKTEIKTDAIREAKAFFNNLILRRAKGVPLTNSPNFKTVAEDLFKVDQERVNRGERKQSVVDDAKSIYESTLVKFFGRSHCKDITYQKLNDYIEYVKNRPDRKPIGSKTLKNHFIILSKILKHASKLGYIDQLPILPTISQTDNPREWFSPPQYEALIRHIDEMIQQRIVVRYVPVTLELKYLVTFIVNSFLRPADLKHLKHKHIEAVTRGELRFLRIMATGKVKAAPVVSMPAAVAIYSELKTFNNGQDEDYLFFPKLTDRGYAMSTMAKQFNEALTRAALKVGSGAPRTLYSLRHTCIMNCLLNGSADILTVARNCRTSVEMIQRFYGSHLTAEMNVERLITRNAVTSEQGASLEPFFRSESKSEVTAEETTTQG